MSKWQGSGDVCRRYVRLCGGTKAKGVKLWAFSYGSLADLLGVSEGAVRQMVNRGQLDPHSLESICEAWRKRQ